MDLHQHMDYIHSQCRSRLFSPDEVSDMMGLCVYAFVSEFPRESKDFYAYRQPFGNRVLSSVAAPETASGRR